MAGSIECNGVGWTRPGGAALFAGVSFSVGAGDRVALVGANGVGKSTLIRILAGDEVATSGSTRIDGRFAYMRQLVGSIRDATTVRDLLVSVSSPALRQADADRRATEALVHDRPQDEQAGMAYAAALATWADVGGWEAEVLWDVCTTRALDRAFDDCADRPLALLSGGEQKKLALEGLLRGDAAVLLLDEPDNFLDVPSKKALEERLRASAKTILLVSHDRHLLAAAATKVVTVEAAGAWTHGGSFASYHDARLARNLRLEELARRHAEDRQRLVDQVAEMRRRARMSEEFAARLKAAESRLRHFDADRPAVERVRDDVVTVRLTGGRTGKRAVVVQALELAGLTEPFDCEILFGERVAVLGPNGTGKSHFLRLLAGGTVDHEGTVALGARVVPGLFSQTHEHPELQPGIHLIDVLLGRDLERTAAMGKLKRYALQGCAEQTFDTLSGGQQARFQVLLLELDGATLLLLDEPTDNLDLHSAEALEEGLAAFEGTVLAVTHDRWFLRAFDRYLVFADDCTVTESLTLPALYR